MILFWQQHYMVISLLHYIFNDYPMHKLLKEQPEYQRMNMSSKGLLKCDTVMFYVATANLAVCFVLLVLKCIGLIEWW